MSHDDPFTIDLFGNTALSSGFGLGVTAFGSSLAPDDDDDPDPVSPTPVVLAKPEEQKARSPSLMPRGENYHLADSRDLAQGWKERARDNIAAIRLAAEIDADERPATHEEQAKLIRFTGFGASDLANGVFRRPGEIEFRKGWDGIGRALEDSVTEADYASLARCTQYTHFTPEFIVKAIWSGLQRLGWRGGRVLEPGIGTGLFPALMPEGLRHVSHVTGIELDPVTARIARLLQPRARIVTGDFARTDLPASFDLAIGNPPFSDRTVRSDRAYRSMKLVLHDYFIARSIDLLKPGALAAFVTSSGTMDKADCTAREHIAKSADLIAAIRLPEGSFRSEAGTDVVVDILFFRKRKAGEPETDGNAYLLPDGKPFELTGAAQMIFSDLGTINVEKTRGFSAYRWIRDELIRLGVPASEIAFMQDYKKSEAKQRLFGDVRAGKVRFLIGSSETMGTGVNAQLRLKALHHLDVPWLPSQIEQREGRIVRQGNQHDEVDIFAYATEGSLDATMWQNNERKARFIAAALSGDTSIRRLEDMGEGQANQFAMAKAIASGDQRLMQKAGLEADIARLERLRAAHIDDQHAVRRQLRDAERDIEYSTRRIAEVGQDIERLVPTVGDAFAINVGGKRYIERKEAGRALMKEILTLVQLQQDSDSIIASFGGFDIEYSGERFGKDGYRYSTALLRTGVEHEIELAMTVTPLGAISRLEHALSGFEHEQERYRQRLADARRRLASYQSRGEDGDFAFAGELAEKRRQLAEVEEALATDTNEGRNPAAIAA